tara:strand:+ start:376 stop:909 length:534 start_codon:yes stop_codon:yes gene_type:complete
MYDLKPQARPYAKAVFLAAVEERQINEMFGDLKILSEACSDSSINKLIESPEEKTVVVSTLKSLFSSQPLKLTENLLDVLGENDRLNLLVAVAEIYENLMLKHNESKVIEVAAPSNLTETTKEIILNKLQDKYGDSSTISFSDDPDLKAGFVVKIGDEVLDLSIKGRIKKLINQLNI